MPTGEPHPQSKLLAALVVAGIAAAAGFAAIYVTLGHPDNAVRPAATAPMGPSRVSSGSAFPSGPGANPLSKGQMAAFVFRKEPEPLPELKFIDGNGRERTLAHWHGKIVLLNLWATWCLPCRKEMPTLDHLQKALGSDQFEVVAISVDRTGVPGAKRFMGEAGIESLALYADPTARMAASLRAVGLPATLLIDRKGREIGRLLGPAEWDSEDAKRLIAAALQ